MSKRDDQRWEALVKPARRIRPGVELDLGVVVATVTHTGPGGVFEVELATTDGSGVEEAVARTGETPLPPYIREPLADAERYQTVFADRVGSAAAPTAGLHFTEQVVGALVERDIGWASVELEVGLDTFRPIGTERIVDHVMHSERYSVPAATARAITATRGAGGRVVAVGTTVVRTLESAFDGQRGGVRARARPTSSSPPATVLGSWTS